MILHFHERTHPFSNANFADASDCGEQRRYVWEENYKHPRPLEARQMQTAETTHLSSGLRNSRVGDTKHTEAANGKRFFTHIKLNVCFFFFEICKFFKACCLLLIQIW